MLIDAHTHVVKSILGLKGYPPAGLVARMRAEGVSQVWGLPGEAFYGNTHTWNEWMLEVTAPFADFFIPFCTVDPKAGSAAVEELEYFVASRGMRGLKLHNWLQAVSTSVTTMDEIVAACAALRVPVIVHDGTPPYCTPLQFARLAESHPKAKIVLGHMGLKDMWPDAVRAARRLSNIYLCTCAAPIGAVRDAIRQVGADRILFGSDCGWEGSEMFLRERLAGIASLSGEGISDKDLDWVYGRTAAKLISQEHP